MAIMAFVRFNGVGLKQETGFSEKSKRVLGLSALPTP